MKRSGVEWRGGGREVAKLDQRRSIHTYMSLPNELDTSSRNQVSLEISWLVVPTCFPCVPAQAYSLSRRARKWSVEQSV